MSEYTLVKPDSIKSRKRVGRGTSSGHGKTSCRGMNGQGQRSGCTRRPWFEGGQLPLYRRLPKRGFTNIFKTEFEVVNISTLDKMSETEITSEVLFKAGVISDLKSYVKILGNGEISKAKTVIADAFSDSAKAKIEKAGGKTQIKK
ncbi:MAG: 50S ribosomal protein L15 [Spirochaetes bacterium]|nr:50S ribosomal protein L15 [Spirochaetota bacterium]